MKRFTTKFPKTKPTTTLALGLLILSAAALVTMPSALATEVLPEFVGDGGATLDGECTLLCEVKKAVIALLKIILE